jgi:hypothetical protein
VAVRVDEARDREMPRHEATLSAAQRPPWPGTHDLLPD